MANSEHAKEAHDLESDPVFPAPQEDSMDDVWAAVVEPVTKRTLMDTLLSQAETLTTVCSFLSARGNGDPTWIEQFYLTMLRDKLTLFAEEPDQQWEVALVKAKFSCAIADAGFSTGRLNLSTYERELDAAYGDMANLNDDPRGLCDRADAEMIFNATVERSLQAIDKLDSDEKTKTNVVRWKHLTNAVDSLTRATKLKNVQNLSRINLRRGDCELLRRRLGDSPASYNIASKSESTLAKNAEVYYRGATRIAQIEGDSDEEREASIKEAVVIAISGDAGKLQNATKADPVYLQEILGEMVDEGLLSQDVIAHLSK